MATLDGFLESVVAEPTDAILWLILADWLGEHDDPRRGELLRLHRRLIATCCEPERHPERAEQQARIVALLGQGVKPCVPERMVVLGVGVEMKFVWIPPGTFLMGSPASEKERSSGDEVWHRVTLTKGLWLGVFSVTQAQWGAATGDNPSHFKGDDLTVEQVSWEDCVAFCERLEEKTGQRFRLPTEAEWEDACRAGTTTPYFFGEKISTDQANYHGDLYTYHKGRKGVYREKTTPVRNFPPNAWGLYDTHGNVWEWCQDWYSDYPKKDQRDPVGGNSGDARVLRGGSWCNHPWNCRSANRIWYNPGYRLDDVGCRILLCLD